MMALAVFAVAALLPLIESRRAAYGGMRRWRSEVRVSLVLGAVAIVIDLAMPAHVGGPAPAGWSMAMLAIAVFLADDLLYYASHRLAHRVGLFWASHAVHHSPVRYDLFMGLRQPPTWLLTPAATAPVLLLALGAPPVLVAMSAILRAVHHFMIHTERVRRLPAFMEYVFNTPSHHRVHHSTEAGCLDRNFGGILIVWDRWFGTFAAEPDGGVRRYGLVHPIRPSVLLVVAEPWRRLAARMRQAPAIRGKLLLMLAPPETSLSVSAGAAETGARDQACLQTIQRGERDVTHPGG